MSQVFQKFGVACLVYVSGAYQSSILLEVVHCRDKGASKRAKGQAVDRSINTHRRRDDEHTNNT